MVNVVPKKIYNGKPVYYIKAINSDKYMYAGLRLAYAYA